MINAFDFKTIGLQKAIDETYLQPDRTLYIPGGNWDIETPLLAAKKDVYGNFVQSSIKIIGDSLFHGMAGTGTQIICHHTAGYGIGFQMNKGSKISGVDFKGQFTTPALSNKDFNNILFEDYTDGKCEDTVNAVYAGIVIDPHQNPVGSKSQTAGSTGVQITDCEMSNFVAGFVCSPNGVTRNAEEIFLRRVAVSHCKAGFVGCQDQEKANEIINSESWGNVHTMFVFNKYGAKKPGHWIIDRFSLASRNANLIYRKSMGYFPLHMYNGYAESLGQLGTWESGVGDSMTNVNLNYQFPENMGGFPIANLLGAGGVKFNNNLERYYGKPKYPIVRYSVNPVPCPDPTKYRLNIVMSGDVMTAKVTGSAMVGDVVQLLHHLSDYHISPAVVTASNGIDYTISYMNKNVKNGGTYKINKL